MLKTIIDITIGTVFFFLMIVDILVNTISIIQHLKENK